MLILQCHRFAGLAGLGAGVWIDAGITHRDAHRVYGVALRSITLGSLIGELAELAKAHYQQEAIYCRYLGVVEIL